MLSQERSQEKLDDDGPLRRIHVDNMSNIINKLNYPFIYCWITSDGIAGDPTQFNFKFNLHYHDNDNLSLCLYKFQTSWKTITFLHNKAFLSHGREHFAKQRFPQMLAETNDHREYRAKEITTLAVFGFIYQEYDDPIDISIIDLCILYIDNIISESLTIKNTLNLMDDIFMINRDIKTIKSFDDEINGNYTCKEPGRLYSRFTFWNGEQREATDNDNDAVSHFLCRIFNSPSFVVDDKSDYSLTQCGIDDNMKHILRSKAESMLNVLRKLAKKDTFYDPNNHVHQKLIEDKWRNTTFHTLYIVTRPTNPNELSLLDHWALKFEGNKWLLTLEWLGSSTFYIKFLENTCLGQKVFWYSWSRTTKQTFTQRWGTLAKLYIHKKVNNHEITAERIYKLLNKWLKYCDEEQFDPKYNRMVNNCQHWVRDFVSVFNENVAEHLTTKFHHRQIEKIMTPSGASSNDLNEYPRIQKIKQLLLDAMDDINEVHYWLQQIGKIEHFSKFKSQGFDTLDMVKLITGNEDLKQMGIDALCDRKIIMNEIKKLHFRRNF